MKSFFIKVIIFIISIATIVGAIYLITTTFELVKKEIDVITGKQIQIESNCEHEYVITSEFSWLSDSYRTISKCTKCGIKIK